MSARAPNARRARRPVTLVGAALAALASACVEAPPAPESAPSATPPSTPSSTPTQAPSASAVAPSGPCGGQPIGAHLCDGARLAVCKDASGAVETVRTCLDIERCDADAGRCAPACPDGEVYIPPTPSEGFVMGRGMASFGFGSRASGRKGSGQADAPHRVVLTRPFCIDANEVTAGQVRACVEQLGCPAPSPLDRWASWPKRLDHPANMVSWTKAKVFCEKNGKSLPSEAQWEWAATGDDRRKWPWGDEPPDCERADFTAETLISPGGDSGCHGGGPSKIGAHPAGAKEWPSGKIFDLAGNVWEWCLDNYLPYATTREVDPVHLKSEGGNHVVRGGGWNRSARGIMNAFRGAAIVTYQVPGLGFRCVRNGR